MAIAQETEITPFIDRFVETGDWATWNALADFFAEGGDEIGEQWALWILQTQRQPDNRNIWWLLDDNDDPRQFSFIPETINESMRWLDHGDWLSGSRSKSESYILLLKHYRIARRGGCTHESLFDDPKNSFPIGR